MCGISLIISGVSIDSSSLLRESDSDLQSLSSPAPESKRVRFQFSHSKMALLLQTHNSFFTIAISSDSCFWVFFNLTIVIVWCFFYLFLFFIFVEDWNCLFVWCGDSEHSVLMGRTHTYNHLDNWFLGYVYVMWEFRGATEFPPPPRAKKKKELWVSSNSYVQKS